MTDEQLTQIKARQSKAFDMVHALCQPYGTGGSRRWIMSIPAQPDYDPDLVIAASLNDIPALLSEVERLRAQNEEYHQALKQALDLASKQHGGAPISWASDPAKSQI